MLHFRTLMVLVAIILYPLFSTYSTAQELKVPLSDVRYVEWEDGLLLYGVDNKSKPVAYEVHHYDFDFNQLGEYRREFPDAKKLANLAVEVTNKTNLEFQVRKDGYFKGRGAFIRLDRKLNELSVEAYEKPENIGHDEALKARSSDYYVRPQVRTPNDAAYVKGQDMVEFVTEYDASSDRYNARRHYLKHNGPSEVRWSKAVDESLWTRYRVDQTIQLSEVDSVIHHQFFPAGEGQVLLYVWGEGENAKWEHWLVHLDIKGREVLSKSKMKLPDPATELVVSNVFWNSANQSAVVYGNYYGVVEDPKADRKEQTLGTFLSQYRSAEKSWNHVLHPFEPMDFNIQGQKAKFERYSDAQAVYFSENGEITILTEEWAAMDRVHDSGTGTFFTNHIAGVSALHFDPNGQLKARNAFVYPDLVKINDSYNPKLPDQYRAARAVFVDPGPTGYSSQVYQATYAAGIQSPSSWAMVIRRWDKSHDDHQVMRFEDGKCVASEKRRWPVAQWIQFLVTPKGEVIQMEFNKSEAVLQKW